MRGYDFWQTQRESADTLEHGVKVRRRDYPPVAMIWRPNATRPTAHVRFRSIEQRDEYIRKFVQAFADELEDRAARRAASRGTAEQRASVGIGTIFAYTWGYEQTNVEFYEVIDKRECSVIVREIAQDCAPGSEGFMSESRMPRPGVFVANAEPMTKVLRFSEDKPYLSFPYGWCGLWDGRPEYCSWYA